MWTVRMVVRVPSGKHSEFVQSGRALLTEELLHRHSARLLQDVGDEDVYCWLADASTRVELTALVESATFHAVRGAAQALGEVEEIRVLRDQT